MGNSFTRVIIWRDFPRIYLILRMSYEKVILTESKQIMSAPPLDTDSEDEIPAGWEERVSIDGEVYYARYLCFIFKQEL